MYKQVIIIRSDLKMERGKLISQSLHAGLGALRLARDEIVRKWEGEGAKKGCIESRLGWIDGNREETEGRKDPPFPG